MPADILHLVIRVGPDRYAIEGSSVVEVASLVRLKALPGAPPGVAGVMNYRSRAVPVVDLEFLHSGHATPSHIGARIVVVAISRGVGIEEHLGLLVPEARETARFRADEFVTPGVATDGARHLGHVVTTAQGVVQLVKVEELLTPEILDAVARAGGA